MGFKQVVPHVTQPITGLKCTILGPLSMCHLQFHDFSLFLTLTCVFLFAMYLVLGLCFWILWVLFEAVHCCFAIVCEKLGSMIAFIRIQVKKVPLLVSA